VADDRFHVGSFANGLNQIKQDIKKSNQTEFQMKILVTYATSSGSTKSIAERIHQRIALANIGDVAIEDVEKKPVIADFGPYKTSSV